MTEKLDDYQTKLGSRIKRRLYRFGLTADLAAEKLGIHPATLSRVITGNADSANWETLQGLAKLLNWSMPEMMDTRQKNTYNTGMRAIDNAVYKFNSLLFAGPRGYEQVKDLFDPDYHIVYMDAPACSDSRIGPNLEDEFAVNYEQVSIGTVQSDVLSISQLASSSTLTLSRVTIKTFPEANQNADGSRGHRIRSNYVDKPMRVTVVDMVDVWELSTTLKEIKKGASYLVLRRYVQNINRRTETY